MRSPGEQQRHPDLQQLRTMVKIIVAGIHGSSLPDRVHPYLRDERYPVFCSQSLLDTVLQVYPRFSKNRWASIIPIDQCFERINTYDSGPGVVVLTSGDPLFYGLGKRIREHFSDSEIMFIPSVSYMQSCFSHFGMNWDDADFLSLHGRPLASIAHRLHSRKLFIYTDPENSPDRIADYLGKLLGKDAYSREIFVGECIGSDQQKYSYGTTEEVSSRTFAQPNCMIVVNHSSDKHRETPRFGLNEEDITHSRGLITKNEVRAAVLHRLALPDDGIFWDIGAGSGSISLEAARMYKSLSIFAIEKEAVQIENISNNKQEYQCSNIQVIEGYAPEVLEDLPHPHRVFIGGSGGRLEEIIDYLAPRVRPGGQVVLTAVLSQTARLSPQFLYKNNFKVDISLIQVSRSGYPEQNLKQFNPIHIIRGIKQ